MKKILALIFLLSTLLLASDGPKLYHDFKSGFAAAQKEGKMMMIMIHLKGCPECAYMEDVVFKDDKVSAYMDANFVNIALEFRETEVPVKYPRIGVPTFYITDKDGNIIGRQIGGTRSDRFLQFLEKAKSKG